MQESEALLPCEEEVMENASEWIIRAPGIEREIRRYYAKHRRGPSEAELEGEINNYPYHEILNFIKDLEVCLLHMENNQELPMNGRTIFRTD